MSVYNSIINGLNEAIEYEKGEMKNITVNRVRIASLPHFHGPEIKAIREKHRLSQQVFAGALGVSKKTVEAWEADRNVPEYWAFFIAWESIYISKLLITW